MDQDQLDYSDTILERSAIGQSTFVCPGAKGKFTHLYRPSLPPSSFPPCPSSTILFFFFIDMFTSILLL